MKTITVVQARTGSQRLPGKTLKRVGDKTILEWVLHRVRLCTTDIGPTIVATSTQPADDQIIQLCDRLGVLCYQGNHLDVLTRFYTLASRIRADAIIRITADCPLLSPQLLADIHQCFTANNLDYCTTRDDVAEGVGQEIISFDTLEHLWRHAKGSDREHVTSHLFNHANPFTLGFVPGPQSSLSYSIDTQDELDSLRALYDLEPRLFDLEAEAIIELAEQNALQVAA